MLEQAKFETKNVPKTPKLTGLSLHNNFVYHKAGYIIPCLLFPFHLKMEKLCHGCIKLISLVTVKMLFL